MRMLKIFLILLLSALVAISGYKIYKEVTTQQKEIEKFDELQEIVEEIPDNTETKNEAISTEEPVEIIEKSRNLAPLFERNSDCIGWICIPETNINYPVMHTPDNPQKYLRKDFDGKYSQSGVPFLDARCNAVSGTAIIYGHNMKNGTQFSDLKNYLNGDFCDSHSVIEYETKSGVRYFIVETVIKTDIYDEIYNQTKNDDDTLILSTCYGSAKSGRLIIIAKEAKADG